MKKSNIVLAVVIIAVSIFLLWLWFYLGFNTVDNPVDLSLSVAWWVIIAAAIALIVWSEKKRQQAIRTVFIGGGKAFNAELGSIDVAGSPVDQIEDVIGKLEYGFGKQAMPKDAAQLYSAIVKSPTFKVTGQDSNGAKQLDWEGEVIFVETGNSVAFSSKEELEKILAA